ncbi:RNA polymerase sigma factor SigI [Paenibacillus sp. GCM10027626]|uniref:RNA polymerase sigma factor SigI n=1 Tax=Paenibacillus sp. GCM10027626 TaxID=3273411 RepID=UPI0036356331
MLLVLFKRMFGKNDPEAAQRDSPEEIVARIREGTASRDAFIAAYQPYIVKVTSRFCKRYVDPTCDDEFSIALSAFDEAIEQYACDAGKSFLGFAETVIRRRLIDYVRKEQRHACSVPYSVFETIDDEELPVNPVETKEAISRYSLHLEAETRRLEIEEYNEILTSYGITFAELPEFSPKHADSRLLLASISCTFATTGTMYESFEASKKLPVKELCQRSGVSRKTIERNRKYIIALAVLYHGDFPYLKTYLEPLLQQRDDQVKGVRA